MLYLHFFKCELNRNLVIWSRLPLISKTEVRSFENVVKPNSPSYKDYSYYIEYYFIRESRIKPQMGRLFQIKADNCPTVELFHSLLNEQFISTQPDIFISIVTILWVGSLDLFFFKVRGSNNLANVKCTTRTKFTAKTNLIFRPGNIELL